MCVETLLKGAVCVKIHMPRKAAALNIHTGRAPQPAEQQQTDRQTINNRRLLSADPLAALLLAAAALTPDIAPRSLCVTALRALCNHPVALGHTSSCEVSTSKPSSCLLRSVAATRACCSDAANIDLRRLLCAAAVVAGQG